MEPEFLLHASGHAYGIEVETLGKRFFRGGNPRPHLHPAYHLILVSRGSCRMILENRPPQTVRLNELIFLNPLVPHTFLAPATTGAEHVSLIWRFRAPDGSCALFPLQHLHQSGSTDAAACRICPLNDFAAKQFLQKQKEAEETAGSGFLHSRKVLEVILLGMEFVFGAEESVPPARNNSARITRQVRELVTEGLGDPDLGVSTLADRLGLNPCYLNTVFKSCAGLPLSQHIAQRRAELAKILLTNGGDRNIGEIARLCGFRQLSYFSRFFRARCGMSPQEYRNRPHPAAVRRPALS